jgi:large conductance mechanosensitive channel
MNNKETIDPTAAGIAKLSPLGEFMSFIREQGVVGLAIGFVLGGSVSKVVSSIASDLIQPLIGYLFGSTSGLASLRLGAIAYGNFLVNVIDFVIIAAVVFLVFKKLRLDKLDKKN